MWNNVTRKVAEARKYWNRLRTQNTRLLKKEERMGVRKRNANRKTELFSRMAFDTNLRLTSFPTSNRPQSSWQKKEGGGHIFVRPPPKHHAPVSQCVSSPNAELCPAGSSPFSSTHHLHVCLSGRVSQLLSAQETPSLGAGLCWTRGSNLPSTQWPQALHWQPRIWAAFRFLRSQVSILRGSVFGTSWRSNQSVDLGKCR